MSKRCMYGKADSSESSNSSITQSSSPLPWINLNNNPRNQDDGPYVCRGCLKEFNSLQALRGHHKKEMDDDQIRRYEEQRLAFQRQEQSFAPRTAVLSPRPLTAVPPTVLNSRPIRPNLVQVRPQVMGAGFTNSSSAFGPFRRGYGPRNQNHYHPYKPPVPVKNQSKAPFKLFGRVLEANAGEGSASSSASARNQNNSEELDLTLRL